MKKPTHHINDPNQEIHVGDCRDILRCCPEKQFDLAFIDPPYNIGQEYDKHNDRMTDEDYWAFLRGCLSAVLRVLASNGTLWTWLPPQLANRVAVFLEGKGLTLRNDIVVVQKFGQWTQSKFPSGHVRLLYFVADPNAFTWNPSQVLVESERAKTYDDKRTQRTKTPGMRVPLDYWGDPERHFGRVQGNNRERRRQHANQVPEAVLFRALLATTNPGDLLLDPFLGSGGSLTVGRALGCRGVGIELSPDYAKSAYERVQRGPVRSVVDVSPGKVDSRTGA